MPQLSELSHSIAIPHGVLPSAGNQTIHFFVPAGTRRLSRKSRVCTFCPSYSHSKQLIHTYRSDIRRRAQQWLTLSYNLTSILFMFTLNRTKLLYAAHVVFRSIKVFIWRPIRDQITLHSFMDLGSYVFSFVTQSSSAVPLHTNRTHNTKFVII